MGVKVNYMTYIAVTNYISSHEDAEQPSCKDIPKTNTGKLKKALFCGYNPTVRPVLHHTNKTVVKMSPYPTQIMWIVSNSIVMIYMNNLLLFSALVCIQVTVFQQNVKIQHNFLQLNKLHTNIIYLSYQCYLYFSIWSLSQDIR